MPVLPLDDFEPGRFVTVLDGKHTTIVSPMGMMPGPRHEELNGAVLRIEEIALPYVIFTMICDEKGRRPNPNEHVIRFSLDTRGWTFMPLPDSYINTLMGPPTNGPHPLT